MWCKVYWTVARVHLISDYMYTQYMEYNAGHTSILWSLSDFGHQQVKNQAVSLGVSNWHDMFYGPLNAVQYNKKYVTSSD